MSHIRKRRKIVLIIKIHQLISVGKGKPLRLVMLEYWICNILRPLVIQIKSQK